MTDKTYLIKLSIALGFAGLQIFFTTTYNLYTPVTSVFLFVLAIITSGWLLHYFVLGVKHYIHYPKKPHHKPYHIINPLLGVGLNIIVLYLMMQLILTHLITTSNLFIS